jgi:hypothetical protein
MGSCPYVGRVPDTPTRAVRLGALALLLRPTYIAAEVVTAAAVTGGYSSVAESVSRLGEVGCTTAYCSARHEVMNGAFVAYGVALAGGALLLSRRLGPWVTGLLVVSGLSSYATGLAPLDQDATLHAIAATPLFVAQPLALLLLGRQVRRERPRLGTALLLTGVLTAAAAVGFVVSGEGRAAGALERAALWPVLLGLAAYAWDTGLSRRARRPAVPAQ